MTDVVACPGCGLAHRSRGLVRPSERTATGECHEEYGVVLSRFYEDAALLPRRQYMVDAYACQHPDGSSRRAIQTTALCLMTLDLVLECGQHVADGSRMHAEMMDSHQDMFVELQAPDLTRALTHRHVAQPDSADYGERAREWAQSVWDVWAPAHEQVRQWNLRTVPHRVR